ncbi:DUF4430 domain-containing protein [Aneurinibacillus thermoaerophilus]|uniref:DUF4430 domain-containing protein n=1 Tax=Aneurinibacillus thermoaerophilus TaxID=143495 RepID=UPI002E22A0F1|nr:DUF4430 domain-containing protein [Aneurinibacillus thermoaerophilus]MED0761159.1 DUF4430 domain-containing protein [Aneurinibacillus thermoaerophilus]
MLKKGNTQLYFLARVLIVLSLLVGCSTAPATTPANTGKAVETSALTQQAEQKQAEQMPTAQASAPALSESQAQTAQPAAMNHPSQSKPIPQKQEKEKNNASSQKQERETTKAVAAAERTVPVQAAAKATVDHAKTKKAQQASETSPAKKMVSFSIVADKERGTILSPTEVEIQEGDTVLDVLKRVTREKKIQMEYRGVKATAYVEGIDNLYEFDRGSKSGWMYRVNGVFPNKSAGIFPVKAGDKIEWLYTVDLGRDLGAKLE